MKGQMKHTMKTKKDKYVNIPFTADDVSELYHIIGNRGFCSTRAKLLNALWELDCDLARRIDAIDDQALAHDLAVHE